MPGRNETGETGVRHIERQNLAYGGWWGSWAQRWIPGVCKHENIRCTHGDEIIGRRWRRRDLPAMCFFTEQPHLSVSEHRS